MCVRSKLGELDTLLKRNEYDIVFISETWLKPFYPDCFLIDTHKFSMIRNDRPIRQGGGVCAIYKNSLASKISKLTIDVDRCIGFQILAFDIYLTKFKYNRFVLVYLPPDCAKRLDSMLSLLNIIKKLNVTPDFHVLGDFNLGKISWKGLASFNLDKPSQLFKDYIDEHNFTQLINFPTHKHDSTLDLIITSQN